jgi:signal-transduction protein with cAMP-binding, CBS, and nucleotidyltransferase domain
VAGRKLPTLSLNAATHRRLPLRVKMRHAGRRRARQQPHSTYYAGCRQWIKPSSCSANACCFATSNVRKRKHFSLASETRDFAAGETIFAIGSPGDSMMIVLRGTVQISVTSPKGQISVTSPKGQPHVAAILSAGEIFGEIAFLDGRARLADAIAITDCSLAIVDRHDLLAFLEQNPGAWQNIVSVLCERLRHPSVRPR